MGCEGSCALFVDYRASRGYAAQARSKAPYKPHAMLTMYNLSPQFPAMQHQSFASTDLMRQLLTGKHLLLVRVRARRVDRELAKVGCRVPAGDVAPPGHTICQGTPCGCLMSLDRYLQDDMHSSAQVSIIKQATCRTICPHPPVVSGLKTGPSGVSCTAPERNCLQYECLAGPMYLA